MSPLSMSSSVQVLVASKENQYKTISKTLRQFWFFDSSWGFASFFFGLFFLDYFFFYSITFYLDFYFYLLSFGCICTYTSSLLAIFILFPKKKRCFPSVNSGVFLLRFMSDCWPNREGQNSCIFPSLLNVSGLIISKIHGSFEEVLRQILPLMQTQLT